MFRFWPEYSSTSIQAAMSGVAVWIIGSTCTKFILTGSIIYYVVLPYNFR